MTAPAGYRRAASGIHPPYDHRAYASTHKRAPRHEPIRIEHTLSEITGPRFARDSLAPGDGDLTLFAGGEALGERIIVTGRVLAEDGRAIPECLIEIWQANAAGRYAHDSDQHEAPLDSALFRNRQGDDGRPRSVPLPDCETGRVSVAQSS